MIIVRHISREVTRPFLTVLGLLTLIFIGYSTAMELADASIGLISTTTAISLILLKTLIVMEVLLPTALYIGVAVAFRNLHSNQEISVLRASGISEFQLLASVGRLALPVTIVVALLSLFVRPWAYGESYALEARAAGDFSFDMVEAAEFTGLEPGSKVLFARQVDSAGQQLGEVFLRWQESPEIISVLVAEKAWLGPAEQDGSHTLHLANGTLYSLDQLGEQHFSQHFRDTMTLVVSDTGPEKKFRRKAASISELWQSDQPRDIAELQGRLSNPLLTLLLAILAVLLSHSTPRQTRTESFLLTIGLYFLILSAIGVARNLLEESRIDPFPGLWSGYLVPIGLLFWLLLKPGRLMRSAIRSAGP